MVATSPSVRDGNQPADTPDIPPQRSPEPVPHLSAGRHLYAQRYVVGWPTHGLVKIGCASNKSRVRRFTSTRGAELIDIAYYERLYDDVRSEVWLAQKVGEIWPRAWSYKHEARFLMGSNTAGWTEFYAIPTDEWPILQEMAAL